MTSFIPRFPFTFLPGGCPQTFISVKVSLTKSYCILTLTTAERYFIKSIEVYFGPALIFTTNGDIPRLSVVGPGGGIRWRHILTRLGQAVVVPGSDIGWQHSLTRLGQAVVGPGSDVGWRL